MSGEAGKFEAKDMEMLRLVLRACSHNVELMRRVILACQAKDTAEVAEVIDAIKAMVEEMEGKPIPTEELICRIATAKAEGELTL